MTFEPDNPDEWRDHSEHREDFANETADAEGWPVIDGVLEQEDDDD